MNQRIKSSLFVVLALAIAAISPALWAAQDDASTTDALKAAIAGPQRSDANKARDKYRHPLETLTFFGIKPDMTVVEVSPGTGWYTEILAPFLKDHGKLYEAVGGGAGARPSRKSSRPIPQSIVRSSSRRYSLQLKPRLRPRAALTWF